MKHNRLSILLGMLLIGASAMAQSAAFFSSQLTVSS